MSEEDSRCWLISVPVPKKKDAKDSKAARNQEMKNLKDLANKGYATVVSEFKVPASDSFAYVPADPVKGTPASGDEPFRTGTLDSLMSLSDDLVKAETTAEQTAFKIYKQLDDMQIEATLAANKPLSDVPEIKVGGLPIQTHVGKFVWNYAKFPVKGPLRQVTDKILGEVGKLDEDFKNKTAAFAAAKNALSQLNRKKEGNLLVRSLNDVIAPEHMTVYGNVAPVAADADSVILPAIVVVPRHMDKEFHNTYEKLTSWVVPKSAKLIYNQDQEHLLYKVLVFRNCPDSGPAAAEAAAAEVAVKNKTKRATLSDPTNAYDDFKNKCREKKFIVRDFAYDPLASEEDKAESLRLNDEVKKQTIFFKQWCDTNFTESYILMMHLKCIRMFVESVLRYGLPINFQAAIIRPAKGKEDACRKKLAEISASFSGASFAGGEEGDEIVPGLSTQEFYPYVYTTVDLKPPSL